MDNTFPFKTTWTGLNLLWHHRTKTTLKTINTLNYNTYIYVKHVHIGFNKSIKYNILSPTTGVGLGKPCKDTVASPLRPKSIVKCQPHHPRQRHIIISIKPICGLSIGPSIGASQLRNHLQKTLVKTLKTKVKLSYESLCISYIY